MYRFKASKESRLAAVQKRREEITEELKSWFQYLICSEKNRHYGKADYAQKMINQHLEELKRLRTYELI